MNFSLKYILTLLAFIRLALSTEIAVLGYHNFSNELEETEMRVKTDKFRQQMQALKSLNIKVISLDEFQQWKSGRLELPLHCALITIDDGWKAVYTDAFPILKEFEYPFTLYLYKNYIQSGNASLTTEMIKEMQENGASLGSHSVSHPLPSVYKAKKDQGTQTYLDFLENEFRESKRFLEATFQTEIYSYVYPGGYIEPLMLPISENEGYELLFTINEGKVTLDSDNQQLPRYMILGTYDQKFQKATTFKGQSREEALPGALIQDFSLPVSPKHNSIIDTRRPTISIDCKKAKINPETVTLKLSGIGVLPTIYNNETGILSWQVNRRLRHPSQTVHITYQDPTTLKNTSKMWNFRINTKALYLPKTN